MAAITQTITVLPDDPPDRDGTPEDFNVNMDSFLGHIPTLISELNIFESQANSLRSDVNADSATASSASTLAVSAKNDAEAAASSAEAVVDQMTEFNSTGYIVKSAREIGGHAYVTMLGLPCPPTLDLKAYDYRNETYGVPSNVTFERATPATQVNAQGLIESVGEDVMRHDYDPVTGEYKGWLIEEGRTNLLTYSEDFDNAAWIKSDITISANAVTAPDGTQTADKLVENTSNIAHYLKISTSVTPGNTYACSVFMKEDPSGSKRYLTIHGRDNAFGTAFSLTFDPSDGSITYNSNPSLSFGVINYENGFYRVWVTATATATYTGTEVFWIRLADESNKATTYPSYTGDGTSGLYLWGAQLEQGSFPTSYIPSTQTFTSRASSATYIDSDGLIATAATDVARMNYNPTALHIAPKLLLEGASTNLLTYSEDFDNAAWNKSNATISANAIAAPDGATTADKLVDSVDNAAHAMSKDITVTTSNNYTFSVFAKSGEMSWLRIRDYNYTGSQAFFDLDNGVIGTNLLCTAKIIKYPNGWYRCIYTATAQSTSFGCFISVCDADNSTAYTGDGTSGLYIWGAQLEESSYPTSYIPSTTAAVTRAADVSTSAAATRDADVCYIDGTDFTDFYNQDEGSLLCKATAKKDFSTLIYLKEDNSNNMRIQYDSTLTPIAIVKSDITYKASTTLSSDGLENIYGLAYKDEDCSSIKNGAVVDFTTSPSTLPSPTEMRLGVLASTSQICGHIKQLTYFPRKLSDSQLQLLTS